MAAPIVIVGGGLAGATAARTLRKEGFDGDIVLHAGEHHRPYERPPLSKNYLRGEADRGAIFTLDEGWYAGNGVDVRRGSAVAGLDPEGHRLTLQDGSTESFRMLLLATGASPRSLDVPGADLQGVLTLRSVESSDLLRARLEAAKRDGSGRVAVVGDGWIGLEVAASARLMGLEVTVLGRGPMPLAGVLGRRIGEVYARLHRENGVDLRTGAHVARILGLDETATGVELEGGETIPADLVVVGVGATPNLGLAAAAGLKLRGADLGGGVAVDGRLATSHPDVYAAGDIASIPIPRWGRPIRVEHWATANRTGPHAARAMLGADAEYTRIPYFFSDQFDADMEYSGFVADPDAAELVLSGDVEARSFAAFWLEDGVVQAGMTMNLPKRIADVEKLIAADEPASPDVLRAFVTG